MGVRIIKTAIAAIIAIYLAFYFELNPALSAGVLAILGIEVTRMKGIQKTAIRFLASVLGLFFASLIFITLGFHYWTVALFILISFPILSRFQLNDGIVTCCVIVFHLYSFGEVTADLLINEICLLLVGLGTATVINMFFMPKDEITIQQLRQQIEQLYDEIFQQLAHTLRDPSHVWSGDQFLMVDKLIKEGKQLSVRNKENRFWEQEAYWITYFEMRSQQLYTISQMMEKVALVYGKLEQGEKLADLFEQVGRDSRSAVYVGDVKEKLSQLKSYFRSLPLPQTREEFEIRASLYMLMYEMDSYLEIARKLKRKKEESQSEAAEVKQSTA